MTLEALLAPYHVEKVPAMRYVRLRRFALLRPTRG